MRRINPFTPTFGSVPPFLAGRAQIIEDVLQGLESGAGEPNRITLFVGARGSGKTALLTKIAEDAQALGWISVNVTAIPGMLEDVIERAQESAAAFIDPDSGSQITGIQLAGFGISRSPANRPQGNWRSRMNVVLDALAKQSVGLLLTVDELGAGSDEIRQLTATFQHFVRERREVALLMAGLPYRISELLQDKSISFLRRAMQQHLGVIAAHEVQETIQRTIELSGRNIESAALSQATEATGGFPFLIQLIGYHIWRQHPEENLISAGDVRRGIQFARAEMETRIFETTIRELSETDVKFLLAMTPDEEESRIADIASRMGVDLNFAGQYRLRLINQGIVAPRGRGLLGFALPMLREYLIKRVQPFSDLSAESTP